MMQFEASPNFNLRPGGIDGIVIHASANSSLRGLVRWFLNTGSRVSAHYCIGKQGKLIQMVLDKHRAWHAGVSQWKDMSDLNDNFLGIELVNLNDGQDLYSYAQLSELRALVCSLVKKYDIDIGNIVSHAEVNVLKNDPLGLDMAMFREAVRLWKYTCEGSFL